MRSILIILTLAIAGLSHAQSSLNITSTAREFNVGVVPTYNAEIPQAKTKSAAKLLEKYARDKGKVKSSESKGESAFSGVVEPNLSPYPFTLYTRFLETNNGLRLSAAIMLSDSQFVSPAKGDEKDIAARKYVRDLAVLVYADAVQDELHIEEDKLKDLNKELNGFIKDQEKSAKTINDNNRQIEQNKKDILVNEQDQKIKMDLITGSKQRIALIPKTATEELKGAIKDQKDLETEKRKLEKANETMHKDIEKLQKEIREEERNINESKASQSAKQKEIANQNAVVRSVETKASGIK